MNRGGNLIETAARIGIVLLVALLVPIVVLAPSSAAESSGAGLSPESSATG
ncbi:MAG TPA: hypothetical protein VIK22_07205 [Candidatus Anoxymicrobiaceae bacterium]